MTGERLPNKTQNIARLRQTATNTRRHVSTFTQDTLETLSYTVKIDIETLTPLT